MQDTRQRYIRMFEEAGIRPSMQRLMILEHIRSRKDHPTADEVYSSLAATNPMLSRTTVFSCLKLLAAKGMINSIDISSDSTRYDAVRELPHAHFMCRRCNRIFDIGLDMSSFDTPEGFIFDNVNVFFKGICPECGGVEADV